MNTISVDELPGISAKVKKKRRQEEWEMQVSVIQWCELQVKTQRHPELRFVYAVPNGIWTSPAQAGKAKASGLKSGVPDLHLPLPRGGFHGLWIELKVGDNDPSQMQDEWLEWLWSVGHLTVICWCYDDAVRTFEEYLAGRFVRPAFNVTEGAPNELRK